MHKDLKLAIAILNGYPRASRERFDAADVGHPHDMYARFLRDGQIIPIAVMVAAGELNPLVAGTERRQQHGNSPGRSVGVRHFLPSAQIKLPASIG